MRRERAHRTEIRFFKYKIVNNMGVLFPTVLSCLRFSLHTKSLSAHITAADIFPSVHCSCLVTMHQEITQIMNNGA